jgi:hypothetical protein
MEESLEAAYAGLESARAHGVEVTMGGLLTTNAAASLFALGRWDDAEQMMLGALRRQVSATYAMAYHHMCAELYTARGEVTAALDHLAAAYDMSTETREPQLVGPLRAADAELQIWSGHCDLARHAVDDGLPRVAEGEHEEAAIRLCAVGIRAEADEAARSRLFGPPTALTHAFARADQLVTQARELFSRLADRGAWLPEAAVQLQLCEAELSRLHERPDPELWQAVVAAWDAMRVVYPAAYARWRLAEATLAVRQPDAAAEVLRVASRVARQLRAVPLAAEIDALARHARIDLHTDDEATAAESDR